MTVIVWRVWLRFRPGHIYQDDRFDDDVSELEAKLLKQSGRVFTDILFDEVHTEEARKLKVASQPKLCPTYYFLTIF